VFTSVTYWASAAARQLISPSSGWAKKARPDVSRVYDFPEHHAVLGFLSPSAETW
jgi:hypothetical protein